ncbi:MAG: hypothetical protein EXR67_04810 [Dehalococcoidia bacterium]|nr:hypothetical protein [Dehalococcoidia bacterium]
MTGKVAEVVESSSTFFVAQCYRLYDAPPLGALVRAGDPSATLGTGSDLIYGIVCNVATGPLDTGRRVLPRGEAEESEEDLYRENPQLSHVLATRFEAAIVAHSTKDGRGKDGLRQGLPPLPPHVHAFVFPCEPSELAQFAKDFRFLHLLLTAPNLSGPAADEVISACLRALVASNKAQNPVPITSGGKAPTDERALLLQAGRALARELTDDAHRLNTLLRGLTQ